MRCTAGAVYVPMRDLFGARIANFEDFDFEIQRSPGHRMIEIHIDGKASHFPNDPLHLALLRIDCHDLTRRQFRRRTNQVFARQAVDDLRIMLTEGILRRDFERETVPGLVPAHLALEPADDAPIAMQIHSRIPAATALRVVIVSRQRIVKRYDSILFDIHKDQI